MFKYFIVYLAIVQFRCISNVSLQPIKNVNIFVGGNDIGKSTLLEAIAMLVRQDSSIPVLETDYYLKEVEKGFRIEATIACESLPPNLKSNKTAGSRSSVKSVPESSRNSNSSEQFEKYFKLRVEGTRDLKLRYTVFEITGMSEFDVEYVLNSLTETRIIGNEMLTQYQHSTPNSKNTVILNLDKNQSQGVGTYMVEHKRYVQFSDQPVQMIDYNNALLGINLPPINETNRNGQVDGLNLSGLQLVGGRQGVSFPLQNWGDGTKGITHRLYSQFCQNPNLIRLVDGFDGKLDIIKLRNYFKNFNRTEQQAFITLSNSEILKFTKAAAVWVHSLDGNFCRLIGDRITHNQKTQPNIFDYKLIIFAEGATEVGFVKALLTLALGKDPELFGIFVCDGAGHERTKDVVHQFLNIKFKVGAFVDLESSEYVELWEKIKEFMGQLVFQWESGCMEENVIDAIYKFAGIKDFDDFDEEILAKFISHPTYGVQMRLRTIADRLGVIPNRQTKLTIKQIKEEMGKLDEFKQLTGNEKQQAIHLKFKQVMREAATGKKVKEKIKFQNGSEVNTKKFQNHGSIWFKSIEGGWELALKLSLCGAWKNNFKKRLLDFVNASLQANELDILDDLPLPQDVDQMKEYIVSIPVYK